MLAAHTDIYINKNPLQSITNISHLVMSLSFFSFGSLILNVSLFHKRYNLLRHFDPSYSVNLFIVQTFGVSAPSSRLSFVIVEWTHTPSSNPNIQEINSVPIGLSILNAFRWITQVKKVVIFHIYWHHLLGSLAPPSWIRSVYYNSLNHIMTMLHI